MPKISVIIPVFNRPLELARALNSLVTQTFKEFEVIICDDGSTENIAVVIKKYQQYLDIKVLRINNSGGAALPRNKGAEIAQSEWIAFLDSDDWWDEIKLERILPYLNLDIDLLHHPLRVVTSSSVKKSREKRRFIGSSFLADPLKHMAIFGNPIACSSVIVRKAKYLELGGMSNQVPMEDFDCWMSLAESGCHFYFLNECLGNYWIGADAISAISLKQIDGQKLLFERHHSFFKDEYLSQAIARQHFVLGMLYWRLGGHIQESLKHLRLAHPLPTLKTQVKRTLALLIVSLSDLLRLKKYLVGDQNK